MLVLRVGAVPHAVATLTDGEQFTAPPGRTTEGNASTAAVAWARGVDLFVACDDRIVRERFRVGSGH